MKVYLVGMVSKRDPQTNGYGPRNGEGDYFTEVGRFVVVEAGTATTAIQTVAAAWGQVGEYVAFEADQRSVGVEVQ